MMNLGTETGSLVNHLMSIGSPIPEVGMAATILSWSDRDAGTVIEVSKSGKTVKVQADKATRIDKNGVSEDQEYEYERDPKGIVETFRLTKRGWNSKSGRRVAFGYRRKFYDYCF